MSSLGGGLRFPNASLIKGRVQDVSLGQRRKAESVGGVPWRGSIITPSHQLWGLRERCELSSGVRGRAPTAQRFSTIFSTQNGLFWHYNLWTIMQPLGVRPRGPLALHTPLSLVFNFNFSRTLEYVFTQISKQLNVKTCAAGDGGRKWPGNRQNH